MATYAELRNLFENSSLENKVEVACLVAAEMIRTEDPETPNHGARLLWAKEALSNYTSMAEHIYPLLLAQNKDNTVQQIIDASDSAIQNAVNSAIDIFATG